MNTEKQMNAQRGIFTRSVAKEEKAFACFARDLKKEKSLRRKDAGIIVLNYDTESRALNFSFDNPYPFHRA
ncbi:MAG: hypothetical protein LBB84_07840 [Tannerellaceae bacterium]|jgi:hypothetical protein|nr:hypothetical protein [Tannerellaceae bacterium]